MYATVWNHNHPYWLFNRPKKINHHSFWVLCNHQKFNFIHFVFKTIDIKQHERHFMCFLHLKFRDAVGGFTQKISVTSHSFWPSQIPLRVTHPLTMGGKHMDLKMAEVSQRQSGHKRGKQNMWPKWFRRHHDSHLEPCGCSPNSARKRKRSFQHAVCSSRWICCNFNWEILAKRNHLY